MIPYNTEAEAQDSTAKPIDKVRGERGKEKIDEASVGTRQESNRRKSVSEQQENPTGQEADKARSFGGKGKNEVCKEGGIRNERIYFSR